MNVNTRLHGAILGLAVGDALGVPVEFRSRKSLDEDQVKEMRAGGTHGQVAGTWSDDSSLTFCLMEELSLGRLDFEEIAGKFLNWLQDAYWTPHGSVFDRGIATTNAILRFDKGEKATLSGGYEEYDNGNGSLMRILPMAFIGNDSNEITRYEMVKYASSITHMHFRSVFACFIYTEYARLLLTGMDKLEAYRVLKADLTQFAIKGEFNPDEISRFDRVLKDDIYRIPREKISGSGYVLHTLEASLWCFLTSDSYAEATLKAVNLGEDTDTTAAVTGGLAGLYYGTEDIPVEWLNLLARKSDIEDLIHRFELALPKLEKI